MSSTIFSHDINETIRKYHFMRDKIEGKMNSLKSWVENLHIAHCEIINVQTVTVTIKNELYKGVYYERLYSDRLENWLYLLSDKLPKTYKTGKSPEHNSTHYQDQHGTEWYIAGYMIEETYDSWWASMRPDSTKEELDREWKQYHPFGPHFDLTVASFVAYNGTMPDKVVPMSINRV